MPIEVRNTGPMEMLIMLLFSICPLDAWICSVYENSINYVHVHIHVHTDTTYLKSKINVNMLIFWYVFILVLFFPFGITVLKNTKILITLYV